MNQERLFKSGPNAHLNACVGTNGGQLGDHAYVLGFAQAAMVLVRRAIDPPRSEISAAQVAELEDDGEVGAHIDALVYPICFCARHHVELFLKRQIDRLKGLRGVAVNQRVMTDHAILPLLQQLREVCDRTDPRLTERLKPVLQPIAELHAFDQTGQTFRYRTSSEQELHLENVSVINLGALESGLKQLFSDTEEFELVAEHIVIEYQQGTFTSKLSRPSLFELAEALPDEATWRESTTFDPIKNAFKTKHGISAREFSEAVDCIKADRTLASRIGMELPLPELCPEVLQKLVSLSATTEDLDAIPAQAWRVLDAIATVGMPSEYPEAFDRLMQPADDVVDTDPPDAVRTMLRAQARFVRGLQKLGQPTLLAAHARGLEARTDEADEATGEFEAMVRRWYFNTLPAVPEAS